MKTEHCPLCKKMMYSDLAAVACQLCGMPLETADALRLRTSGETMLFCSRRCLESFRRPGAET